jgi:hypothetical protein
MNLFKTRCKEPLAGLSDALLGYLYQAERDDALDVHALGEFPADDWEDDPFQTCDFEELSLAE